MSLAKNLFAVLGHYRNRLRCCEAYLKDSTQLLQVKFSSCNKTPVLIFSDILTQKFCLPCPTGVNLESHSYKQQCEQQQWISLARAVASVQHWAGTLNLNIVQKLRNQPGLKTPLSLQFDKVQESFLPLEQQTSTFQAHLEGLEKGNQRGHAGPLAHANGAHSRSASPQTSLHLDSERTSDVEHNNSTSASTSVSSMDADTDTEIDNPRSLCERSALQFTSTIGRLRKSARRKWLLSHSTYIMNQRFYWTREV